MENFSSCFFVAFKFAIECRSSSLINGRPDVVVVVEFSITVVFFNDDFVNKLEDKFDTGDNCEYEDDVNCDDTYEGEEIVDCL